MDFDYEQARLLAPMAGQGAQWSTLLPLRRVEVEAVRDRRARRSVWLVYRFWSAEWTPWQALERVRTDWPELMFDIRPQYARADAGNTADAA